VVQVTAVTPVAKMVGSSRIVLGHGIVHIFGNADLSLNEEKDLRRQLVRQALEALQSEGTSQK